MYNVSWQVIPFPYNANKKRTFVTITNRSCMRTIGKLKEIWERDMIHTKSYLITSK